VEFQKSLKDKRTGPVQGRTPLLDGQIVETKGELMGPKCKKQVQTTLEQAQANSGRIIEAMLGPEVKKQVRSKSVSSATSRQL